MSSSLYIPCESIDQRDELHQFILNNFEFPDYPEYIGVDLCYVLDEYKNCHVGFQKGPCSEYITKLMIICLSLLARKRGLKVFWDFDDLEIESFTDENLMSIENFIQRNINKYKSANGISKWKKIKAKIFFNIGFNIGFNRKEKNYRKKIFEKCNEVIDKFHSFQ
jgi:hypothetical protein